MIFICGSFTRGRKKPCLHCKHFLFWGVGGGSCMIKKDYGNGEDYVATHNHCKYYKRDRYMYTKDGVCKHPEEEYL